jgi:tocopherol cyclase
MGASLLCVGFALAQKPQVMQGKRKAGYASRKVHHPSMFQGGQRRQNYYEGWYYKCVSADGETAFALIPGVALDENGEHSHAFVQKIDGKTGEAAYFEFPIGQFSYSQRSFEARIGDNYFSEDSVHVALQEGNTRFAADLKFSNLHPWPIRPFSPGIMGWYRFVPKMETCHGLVSLHHTIHGMVNDGGKSIRMDGGRGYIEKDWGSSFPSSYVWMQSNGFAQDSASFMCSVATIPYLGKYFRGFLGFAFVNGKLYKFATYTHAKLEQLQISENEVRFTIREKRFTLEIHALRRLSGVLMAPQSGHMARRISESVDAEIEMRLLDRNGLVLFEGKGKNAGLEIVGDRAQLLEKEGK